MNQKNERLSGAGCIEAIGPQPFITRKVYRRADGSLTVWSSRHHRKRIVPPEAAKAVTASETLLRWLWMPGKLNWWIGVVFSVGALLFAVASVLCLSPALAKTWSLDSREINAIYFAGSIPFTIAAYLQLFQAANAHDSLNDDPSSPRRSTPFGWRPRDIGWLSCALQFVGTILFNLNTFDAMIPSLTWFEQDLVIWVPNIAGSILFLLSGYAAFIETCHSHWIWKPRSISWWVVFVNLLGCIGFMTSALFSIILPGPQDTLVATLAVAFTLQGALCFLVGSLLMLPEAAVHPPSECFFGNRTAIKHLVR